MHKNVYCRIASFRVCGKFELSAESGRPRRPLLECMIELSEKAVYFNPRFNLLPRTPSHHFVLLYRKN